MRLTRVALVVLAVVAVTHFSNQTGDESEDSGSLQKIVADFLECNCVNNDAAETSTAPIDQTAVTEIPSVNLIPDDMLVLVMQMTAEKSNGVFLQESVRRVCKDWRDLAKRNQEHLWSVVTLDSTKVQPRLGPSTSRAADNPPVDSPPAPPPAEAAVLEHAPLLRCLRIEDTDKHPAPWAKPALLRTQVVVGEELELGRGIMNEQIVYDAAMRLLKRSKKLKGLLMTGGGPRSEDFAPIFEQERLEKLCIMERGTDYNNELQNTLPFLKVLEILPNPKLINDYEWRRISRMTLHLIEGAAGNLERLYLSPSLLPSVMDPPAVDNPIHEATVTAATKAALTHCTKLKYLVIEGRWLEAVMAEVQQSVLNGKQPEWGQELEELEVDLWQSQGDAFVPAVDSFFKLSKSLPKLSKLALLVSRGDLKKCYKMVKNFPYPRFGKLVVECKISI